MAIGERIRFFRNLKGMTQKWLGIAVGFPEKTADIRMAQYESGSRTPKAELTEKLANVLEVSPLALSVPDIDTELGLLHTLMALEDTCGLRIDKLDGETCIRLDSEKNTGNGFLHDFFDEWQKQAERWRNGEITREEYDRWRYNYPKYAPNGGYAETPSQELSDTLTDAFSKYIQE